jgi:hypothetical protein
MFQTARQEMAGAVAFEFRLEQLIFQGGQAANALADVAGQGGSSVNVMKLE